MSARTGQVGQGGRRWSLRYRTSQSGPPRRGRPRSPATSRAGAGGVGAGGRGAGDGDSRGGRAGAAPPGSAADALAPLIRALVGTAVPVRFEFWDGSGIGPTDGIGTVRIRSVDALRRILWAPGELGVARAFVAGDLTIEGDIYTLLRVLHDASPRDLRHDGPAVPPHGDRCRPAAGGTRAAAARPPPEECRPAGRLHSPSRDAAVISHHYDVGNEFYRLVLGPSMTYSCARFVTDEHHPRGGPGRQARADLPQARSRPAARGPAARRGLRLGLDGHPCRPPSPGRGHRGGPQPRAGRRGQTPGGRRPVWPTRSRSDSRTTATCAASSSTPSRRSACSNMWAPPAWPSTSRHSGGCWSRPGRLLNHAISKPGGSFLGGRTFIGRYVFPDGELFDVADVVRAMQQTGFEVRDVESLREHYSRTLHHWVANLEEQLGRGGGAGRAAPGQHLAAVHGGVGQRLRRRRPGHPPGARRGRRRRRPQRHAAHPGGVGLSPHRTPRRCGTVSGW